MRGSLFSEKKSIPDIRKIVVIRPNHSTTKSRLQLGLVSYIDTKFV